MYSSFCYYHHDKFAVKYKIYLQSSCILPQLSILLIRTRAQCQVMEQRQEHVRVGSRKIVQYLEIRLLLCRNYIICIGISLDLIFIILIILLILYIYLFLVIWFYLFKIFTGNINFTVFYYYSKLCF